MTQQVYYSLQDRRQLPAGLEWLTAAERAHLDGFRFDKRRRDWLLGRWTAKQAVMTVAALSNPSRVEVATANDGAPLPRLDDRPFGAVMSLSHSNDRAFCAVAFGRTELGCDIELVESRGRAFVETYFTDAESRQIIDADQHDRDLLTTTIWSAKESVLKALRIGLGADTRSVEIIPDERFAKHGNQQSATWQAGRAAVRNAGEFGCWWRRDGDFVLSIAARAPLPAPMPVGSETLAA